MEFPHLGTHCAVSSCSKLDFLPFECDCCHKIFCKEHKGYEEHNCTESYVKDIRVPVCPLCNQPVPVKRGEDPNIKVNEHITRDCKEQKKQKLYTNRCSFSGCKKKELVPVLCNSCKRNFCIQHRFETTHNCQGMVGPGRSSTTRSPSSSSKSSHRGRSSGASTKPQTTLMSEIGASLNRERQERQQRQRQSRGESSSSHHHYQSTTQGLSDDEAMARAVAASLADTSQQQQPVQAATSQPPSDQSYDEDEALARAVAASLAEQESTVSRQRKQQASTNQVRNSTKEDSNCVIC